MGKEFDFPVLQQPSWYRSGFSNQSEIKSDDAPWSINDHKDERSAVGAICFGYPVPSKEQLGF